MLWKNVAYLMRENHSVDELHRPRIEYTKTKIFCNVKSIGQSEFYQAQASGFKPEIKLETKLVKLTDDVTHVEYKGKVYKILRTYEKVDITEITLTSMVINNE